MFSGGPGLGTPARLVAAVQWWVVVVAVWWWQRTFLPRWRTRPVAAWAPTHHSSQAPPILEPPFFHSDRQLGRRKACAWWLSHLQLCEGEGRTMILREGV